MRVFQKKRNLEIITSSSKEPKIAIIVYTTSENHQTKEVYMPAYEYVCKDCTNGFTVFLSIKEFEAKPKIKCPQCQSDNVQKKLSAFIAKTSKKS